MSELRHKRIGRACDQHGDDRAAPPLARGLDSDSTRQRLFELRKERDFDEQLKQRDQRRDRNEHRKQDKPFLAHGGLVRGFRTGQSTGERAVEPIERNGEPARIMRGEPVVCVKQLHAPRGAVGKVAEGRIPRSFVRGRAEEFGAQGRAEDRVVHIVFIIAEVAEFVPLRLQQENVVEMNVCGVVHRVKKQLAALQYGRLRLDFRAGIRGGNAPTRPGTHRMSADAELCFVDILKLGEIFVRRDAAARAVRNGVPGVVLRVKIIEEGEVREVHQKPIAHRAADGLEHRGFITEVSLDHVVDIAAVFKTGFACAVPVLVDRKHNDAALRQLDRVCRVRFMVVLIPVQKQNARRFFAVLQSRRRIELIKKSADLRRQIPLRDRDRIVRLLNAVCKEQRNERDAEQHRQSSSPFSPTFFHTNPL